MDDITETVFKDFIVTCHTEGCENENIGIEFPVDIAGMLVYCGPCMTLIEDFVPVDNKV